MAERFEVMVQRVHPRAREALLARAEQKLEEAKATCEAFSASFLEAPARALSDAGSVFAAVAAEEVWGLVVAKLQEGDDETVTALLAELNAQAVNGTANEARSTSVTVDYLAQCRRVERARAVRAVLLAITKGQIAEP